MPIEYIPHIINLAAMGGEHDVASREDRGISADTFVVLMCGGNYEESDRKGWDTSIQAFARFHQTHPDSHLYIHAIESPSIIEDDKGTAAPVGVMPTGVPLRLRLHYAKVPTHAYTLDHGIYPSEEVPALKRMADVCLHASKTEGFGMNVLECQAVGTPVITTDFLAMHDFTRLGTAVPYRQTYFRADLRREMAMPDVDGISAALEEHYSIHRRAQTDPATASAVAKNKTAARDWVGQEFAASAVGERFAGLLDRAYATIAARLPPATKPPAYSKEPLFTVLTEEHPRIVDWDTDWTLLAPPHAELDLVKIQKAAWKVANAPDGGEKYVMFVPTKDISGREVPLAGEGQFKGTMHQDSALLVRTYYFAQHQTMTSNRFGVMWRILSQNFDFSRRAAQLPPGLSKLREQPKGGAALGGRADRSKRIREEL
jgi:hypothetical protein